VNDEGWCGTSTPVDPAPSVSTRLDAVSLERAWTVERAERWWATHRPADARPVADVLLSQEGRELRIGPRARPRG